jgi:ABC-type nitrate/sulfonate/bicarbonate transport system ATPase subunit
MTDTHFLVMDEPFSGLDLVNGLKLVDMISRVAHSDTRNTILIITHDVSMAIAVSDTIHLIGRVRDEAGRPQSGCGARIVAEYDLVERGLAYQPDIASRPEYHELRREIAVQFQDL